MRTLLLMSLLLVGPFCHGNSIGRYWTDEKEPDQLS